MTPQKPEIPPQTGNRSRWFKTFVSGSIVLQTLVGDFTWLRGKHTLVVGLGPIGLLAAMGLRLRGAEVTGVDIVDENSIRPSVLRELGGKYVDGRKVKTIDLDDTLGQLDLVFEATGVAQLEFDLIDALGTNGAYVLTGIRTPILPRPWRTPLPTRSSA